MYVHFTIPIKFATQPHPLGCSPDDWFDVFVPEGVDDPEGYARRVVVDLMGNDTWMSTRVDGPDWSESKALYYPGKCKAVLNETKPAPATLVELDLEGDR